MESQRGQQGFLEWRLKGRVEGWQGSPVSEALGGLQGLLREKWRGRQPRKQRGLRLARCPSQPLKQGLRVSKPRNLGQPDPAAGSPSRTHILDSAVTQAWEPAREHSCQSQLRLQTQNLHT